MIVRLLLLSILPLFIAACNRPASVTIEEQGSGKDRVENFDSPDSTSERHVVFQYQRTPCYGKCPVFAYTLYSDGWVLYEGIHYTELEGKHEGSLSVEDMELLKREVENIYFFSLDDYYPAKDRMIMDLPRRIIFYSARNQNKQITYQIGRAPETLLQLSEFIEEMFKNVHWTRFND